MIHEASNVFGYTGINIITSCRFLRGCIGEPDTITSFVLSKVGDWSQYITLLSSVAKDQPQAAYVALTKSLQQEWIFLQ